MVSNGRDGNLFAAIFMQGSGLSRSATSADLQFRLWPPITTRHLHLEPCEAQQGCKDDGLFREKLDPGFVLPFRTIKCDR